MVLPLVPPAPVVSEPLPDAPGEVVPVSEPDPEAPDVPEPDVDEPLVSPERLPEAPVLSLCSPPPHFAARPVIAAPVKSNTLKCFLIIERPPRQ